ENFDRVNFQFFLADHACHDHLLSAAFLPVNDRRRADTVTGIELNNDAPSAARVLAVDDKGMAIKSRLTGMCPQGLSWKKVSFRRFLSLVLPSHSAEDPALVTHVQVQPNCDSDVSDLLFIERSLNPLFRPRHNDRLSLQLGGRARRAALRSRESRQPKGECSQNQTLDHRQPPSSFDRPRASLMSKLPL